MSKLKKRYRTIASGGQRFVGSHALLTAMIGAVRRVTYIQLLLIRNVLALVGPRALARTVSIVVDQRFVGCGRERKPEAIFRYQASAKSRVLAVFYRNDRWRVLLSSAEENISVNISPAH